jgi:hypothetical protein
MSRLETTNPAATEPGASSRVPGFGRVEAAKSAAAFVRLPNIAHDGNAEAVLKRLQDKWSSEFRDGARCGFLKGHEGVRGSGGYPPGFDHWQLERRNAWFGKFNVGFHDRSRLSKSEAA